MTTQAKSRQVEQTWRDPEFWGPRGRGCAHCHEGLPIVKDSEPLEVTSKALKLMAAVVPIISLSPTDKAFV